MMLQCTSKADMEDWVRDINRLRGGRVDLASGQNLTEFPTGQDIYEGGCGYHSLYARSLYLCDCVSNAVVSVCVCVCVCTCACAYM